ncbi:hypothetical protein ACFS27_15045 [Promicromonospora vindobonensis]|uniref:DUF4439 domain-containing protein n=1 Tax=Promicromonospora vindobonensis TaxID=195748 RepID=A0ABW5VT77_9MICO
MAAAVLVAATALTLLVVQPWETAEPSPGGIEVDPARVAELEAAEAARDGENLTAAAELATSAQERLLPVMDGLYEALPTGDESGDASAADASAGGPEGNGKPPTAAELGEWRGVVQEVSAEIEALPSGSSEHNIVRNGLLLSTRLLGDTLDVVELAGAGGGSGESERLSAVAGDLRTRAVDAWAVAAVQLDLQYIAAERGHLHAFLPLHSGMSAEGEAELPHGDH